MKGIVSLAISALCPLLLLPGIALGQIDCSFELTCSSCLARTDCAWSVDTCFAGTCATNPLVPQDAACFDSSVYSSDQCEIAGGGGGLPEQLPEISCEDLTTCRDCLESSSTSDVYCAWSAGSCYAGCTDPLVPADAPCVTGFDGAPLDLCSGASGGTTSAPTDEGDGGGTAAPTTVAPTTMAPTTAAPTTIAPTTVAPTASPNTCPEGTVERGSTPSDNGETCLLCVPIDDQTCSVECVGSSICTCDIPNATQAEIDQCCLSDPCCELCAGFGTPECDSSSCNFSPENCGTTVCFVPPDTAPTAPPAGVPVTAAPVAVPIPVTAAPTTAAPTVAPTTAAPTAVPTTVAPTDEPTIANSCPAGHVQEGETIKDGEMCLFCIPEGPTECAVGCVGPGICECAPPDYTQTQTEQCCEVNSCCKGCDPAGRNTTECNAITCAFVPEGCGKTVCFMTLPPTVAPTASPSSKPSVQASFPPSDLASSHPSSAPTMAPTELKTCPKNTTEEAETIRETDPALICKFCIPVGVLNCSVGCLSPPLCNCNQTGATQDEIDECCADNPCCDACETATTEPECINPDCSFVPKDCGTVVCYVEEELPGGGVSNAPTAKKTDPPTREPTTTEPSAATAGQIGALVTTFGCAIAAALFLA